MALAEIWDHLIKGSIFCKTIHILVLQNLSFLDFLAVNYQLQTRTKYYQMPLLIVDCSTLCFRSHLTLPIDVLPI